MVRKVQVMSEEELARYNKQRADEDECCHKIYMSCCLALCILGTVYLIVMLILITIHLYESDDNLDSNDLVLDSGSQIQ